MASAKGVTEIGDKLREAAKEGKLSVLRKLLSEHIAVAHDPSAPGPCWDAAKGACSVVNEQDYAGWNILLLACGSGHLECVREILAPTGLGRQAGFTAVNATNLNGWNALHCAVFYLSANPEVVKELLGELGTNAGFTAANNGDTDGLTALHAWTLEANLEILDALLSSPKFTVQNSGAKYRRTPLHMLCLQNKLEAIPRLVSSASRPGGFQSCNATDTFGNAPLHLAIDCKAPEVVRALLSCSEIDPNVPTTMNEEAKES